MYIEISGDTENLVREFLGIWRFRIGRGSRFPRWRTWAIEHPARVSLVLQLDQDTDIRVLVTEQGVLPFDPSRPIPDFWPEDESADEFLAFLRKVRRDSSQTGKRS